MQKHESRATQFGITDLNVLATPNSGTPTIASTTHPLHVLKPQFLLSIINSFEMGGGGEKVPGQ
jgi:hypothetical protein